MPATRLGTHPPTDVARDSTLHPNAVYRRPTPYARWGENGRRPPAGTRQSPRVRPGRGHPRAVAAGGVRAVAGAGSADGTFRPRSGTADRRRVFGTLCGYGTTTSLAATGLTEASHPQCVVASRKM